MAAVLVVGLLVAVVVSRRGPPALEIPWRLQAGSAVMGAPQIEGADLFVATRAGTVVAADAESGEPRWRFETGERLQAAPVVEGGLVYVATEAGDSGSASLFAVDARTGTEQWGATLDVATAGRLVVDEGLVYVPADDVIAYDALTGEERWRAAAPATGVVSLAAGSGMVVVTGTSGLTALDGLTGDERWTVPTAGPLPVAPAVVGERVIAGDGGGHLVGRDPSDGAERWRAPDAGLVQPPVVAGPVIVLATKDGVVALSSATGERRWDRELNGNPGGDGVRVTSDGSAVAATSGGQLTLFDATTGEALGSAPLVDEGSATPAVAGGRVYVAHGETVTAFDRPAA